MAPGCTGRRRPPATTLVACAVLWERRGLAGLRACSGLEGALAFESESGAFLRMQGGTYVDEKQVESVRVDYHVLHYKCT